MTGFKQRRVKTTKAKLRPIRKIGTAKLSGSGF